MTNKKAIEGFEKLLKDIEPDNHLFVGTINPEFVEAAISALMKQIPKKTLTYEMGLDGKIEIPCGNCGSSLDGIWDYCPFCGQEILWRVKGDTTRSD